MSTSNSIVATVTIISKERNIVQYVSQNISPDPTQVNGTITFPFSCHAAAISNVSSITMYPNVGSNNAIYVNNVTVDLNAFGENNHQITGEI